MSQILAVFAGAANGATEEVWRAEWEHRLDAQLAGLLETVLACERAAFHEDRIDAMVKYGDPR